MIILHLMRSYYYNNIDNIMYKSDLIVTYEIKRLWCHAFKKSCTDFKN